MNTYEVITPGLIVGPLPDFTTMVMVKAGGKTFPISTSVHEAQVFSSSLAGLSVSPYEFMSEIVSSMGGHITHTEIMAVDQSMYSSIFIEYINSEGQNIRRKISSDNPMHAITVSVAANCEARISSGTLNFIKDCSSSLNDLNETLSNEYGKSWPLPIVICKGTILRSLSEFIDEAMPNGKIIRR